MTTIQTSEVNVTIAPHDIYIHFQKNQAPILYLNELQTVIDSIIKEHGEFYLKVSWWSDGVQLITPSKTPEKTILQATNPVPTD